MSRIDPTVRAVTFALTVMALAVPVFGQQSTVATSVWNGSFAPWNSAVDWDSGQGNPTAGPLRLRVRGRF
jgi:hypothetical protein